MVSVRATVTEEALNNLQYKNMVTNQKGRYRFAKNSAFERFHLVGQIKPFWIPISEPKARVPVKWHRTSRSKR